MEPLDWIDLDVEPARLLGWFRGVIERGGYVDEAEWNKAVDALRNTRRRP